MLFALAFSVIGQSEVVDDLDSIPLLALDDVVSDNSYQGIKLTNSVLEIFNLQDIPDAYVDADAIRVDWDNRQLQIDSLIYEINPTSSSDFIDGDKHQDFLNAFEIDDVIEIYMSGVYVGVIGFRRVEVRNHVIELFEIDDDLTPIIVMEMLFIRQQSDGSTVFLIVSQPIEGTTRFHNGVFDLNYGYFPPLHTAFEELNPGAVANLRFIIPNSASSDKWNPFGEDERTVMTISRIKNADATRFGLLYWESFYSDTTLQNLNKIYTNDIEQNSVLWVQPFDVIYVPNQYSQPSVVE